ncbi:MAG: FAD-binding oxidoreductase [Alphaproteobacteria bacterium]|nr:FAD-binding oxidoreductase [Alphaproteobacteria bacterium]
MAEQNNTWLLTRLREALGEKAVRGPEEVSAWRAPPWPTPVPRAGAGVVRPATLEEAALTLRLCAEAGQRIVVAGGLTGLVHATDSAPDELILSLERMNRIRDIDPDGRVMIAEAGVTVEAAQKAADEAGLFYPVDFGARGSATIGGSLSTNAGGNRVIRWGMTRDRVLGIEAALPDGTVLRALNTLIKNNTGYDLKDLLIGAEGTLGVITAATLRLAEKPTSQCLAFAAVPSFASLKSFLRHMDQRLGGMLSAFEVMWPEAYQVLTSPPAKGRPPVPHGSPFTVLVEAMGGDLAADTERFETALAEAHDQGLITDAAMAKSGAEIDAFWRIRDDVLQFAQFWPLQTFDVSLPITAMEGYIDTLEASLSARFPGVRNFVFGHLGDGNLHLVIAPGAEDEETKRSVERLVYEPLRAISGSVSAEHGIGIEKRDYLAVSRTPEEIAWMKKLKDLFDPKGILNPGRVLMG